MYKDTAIDSNYRYYVNNGGSWADWFDNGNTADCTFNSCSTYLSTSVGGSITSSYGDVTNAGIVYFDSDVFNPTSSTSYVNKVFHVKCEFGSPNADVISNSMTVTLACLCNQYTVTLTDYSMSTAAESVTMTSSNQPRWLMWHWDNSNTVCCVTEPTTGSISQLEVYSDAALTTPHPDLEIVYYSTYKFYT